MRLLETNLRGTWLIATEPSWDARGSFARTFCVHEFSEFGLESNFVQHSMSYSTLKGTLRGMHFQCMPHGEAKVVSCRQGAIWDVVVDLRTYSPTYGCWASFELTRENGRQLYVPPGLAHGFQTLSDHAEVHYLISEFHEPQAASGVRYNDPFFGIEWPLPPSIISDRDAAWPDFQVEAW